MMNGLKPGHITPVLASTVMTRSDKGVWCETMQKPTKLRKGTYLYYLHPADLDLHHTRLCELSITPLFGKAARTVGKGQG
jgi:hypothetical protein